MRGHDRRRGRTPACVLVPALAALLLPAAGAAAAEPLPAGCRAGTEATVDYPGAVDCVVSPATTFDCNRSEAKYPSCNYRGATRPASHSVEAVVVHDIEGTAPSAIATFQLPGSGVVAHYTVARDGTVYQTLREADIGYQAGNFWANEHTIGIEHEGFAATGWQWYSAEQYAASAKLTAYLLDKYGLPADRAHVVGHGTLPAPAASSGNHVDPGPYWLWDHYLGLVRAAGAAAPAPAGEPRVFTLRTGHAPGRGGAQTPADFGYFYLYRGPSTASGLIPQAADGTDVLDETNNVEAGMSYYGLDARPDAAGTGAVMIEIWYGHAESTRDTPPSRLETARRAWLAVPPGVWVVPGVGSAVAVLGTGADGADPAPIYGGPIPDAAHTLGSAPAGAVFVAMSTVRGDDGADWHVIAYDHRLAFVPATSVAPAANM